MIVGNSNNNKPPSQLPPKDTSPLLTKDADVGSPPAYNQSGGQPSQLPPPLQQQPIYIDHRPCNESESSQRACKRFTGAFFVALLVWMLMSFLVASFNDAIMYGYGFGRWDSFNPQWDRHSHWDLVDDKCDMNWDSRALSPTGQVYWPETDKPEINIEIPDIEIDVPDAMARGPYAAKLNFNLSLNASSHLLVSDNTWGDVNFVQGSEGDKITVQVTAYYWKKQVWNRTKVCKITDGKGGEGIGLSVPRFRTWWNWSRRVDQVSFSIVVSLPTPKLGNSPNYINAFETDLSIFQHEIHRLTDAVHFGSLNLRTSDARISTEDDGKTFAVVGDKVDFRTSNGGITASASAPVVDIRSSNGRISGNFISNDTLIIRTSNGAIDITAKLQDSGKETTKEHPYIELRTNNAHIKSAIDLERPGKESGGVFEVSTTTSNGPIDLSFPSSPHTSFLKLNCQTSNARQLVHLNKAWEGTFDVSTSSYIAPVLIVASNYPNVKDPSGKGRKRVSTGIVGKGHANMKVSWGEWKEGQKHYGSVTMRTSNAKPFLTY